MWNLRRLRSLGWRGRVGVEPYVGFVSIDEISVEVSLKGGLYSLYRWDDWWGADGAGIYRFLTIICFWLPHAFEALRSVRGLFRSKWKWVRAEGLVALHGR